MADRNSSMINLWEIGREKLVGEPPISQKRRHPLSGEVQGSQLIGHLRRSDVSRYDWNGQLRALRQMNNRFNDLMGE